jgi:GNAT superfamily N-acetyltransferase
MSPDQRPNQAPQNQVPEAQIHYRRGTAADLTAAHALFFDTISDLVWRMGIQDNEPTPSKAERDADFRRWQPVLEHLTATADQYWIAERDGELMGFARSILRDNVRELTEFFVSPRAQSDGIGRELLARAMPPGARRTYIMASLDLRAQALYHKLGVYQISAVYTFAKNRERFVPLQPNVQTPAQSEAQSVRSEDQTTDQPIDRATEVATEVAREITKEITIDEDTPSIIPMTAEHLPMLAALDETIHGHHRDMDHAWLMAQRAGFLLLRDDRAVGYGYVGEPYSGPFVMLNTADFPVALAYAENFALEHGFANFGVDVPMINRTAIRFLLDRGYQMSPFFCFYMCDEQPLHVDKTIITGPMIMV